MKSVSPFRVKPEKAHGLNEESATQGFSVHKSIKTNEPQLNVASTNDFHTRSNVI